MIGTLGGMALELLCAVGIIAVPMGAFMLATDLVPAWARRHKHPGRHARKAQNA